MATTNGWLAVAALDELEAAGVKFALLHGESQVACGNVGSDVDMVIDRPAREVVRLLTDSEVRPVMLWTYDTGSASVFLAPRSGVGGAQLDMTWDDRGRGRYGLRSALLIDNATRGARWLKIAERDHDEYLARKREIKASGMKRTLNPSRIVQRLLCPAGFWAHLPGLDQAQIAAVRSQLAGFLPRVVVNRGDLGRLRRAWTRRFPEVMLSGGCQNPGRGRPDAVVSVASHDQAFAEVVSAMAARCAERAR